MSFLVMISVFIAAIGIAGMWLFLYEKRKQQKRKGRLLQHFSHLGSEYAMRFSGQDTLRNCVVGLDGVHSMLLIMTHDEEGNIKGEEVIHLADVKRCELQKHYKHSVHHCRDRNKQDDLEKIVLLFEREGRPVVEVPFYHHLQNDHRDVVGMERKAAHWQTILRKMMRKETRKIA
ncbi:MAG: hypothetical protein EOO10_01330 [Chitinophagaceae bacterium]|nr:MAG: hypothetical protein EOO10_01330 [Chitinophagaceae bacterium]